MITRSEESSEDVQPIRPLNLKRLVIVCPLVEDDAGTTVKLNAQFRLRRNFDFLYLLPNRPKELGRRGKARLTNAIDRQFALNRNLSFFMKIQLKLRTAHAHLNHLHPLKELESDRIRH